MLPTVVPQLVASDRARAMRQAIAYPNRFACEPKVDGVRGLVGERRDWLRGDGFDAGLRRLADRLPNLWQGTVLDGELTAGRFEGTMSALLGSKRFLSSLRFVVFDVPVLLGADLRGLPGRNGGTASSYSRAPSTSRWSSARSSSRRWRSSTT